MNFLKSRLNVRSSIFGALVTLGIIFGTVSILIPASSQSNTIQSQGTKNEVAQENSESSNIDEVPASTATDESVSTDSSTVTNQQPAPGQNVAGTNVEVKPSTGTNQPTRTLDFVKGGFSQDGPVVSISSLTNEIIPSGTCTYTFENTDYRKATYTNKSSDRGCIANMPVSLFPYSSDTWYFDGASYKADDGSVVIAARPQRSWPTVIVRSQDVTFTNVSVSPMSDMTTVNAYINKQIPGTCTLRFTSIADPSVSFTHTSPTIGPTEITELSNSGVSMCGVALFHSSIPLQGSYSYQITFKDHAGYITTSIAGTLSTQ